VPAPPPPAWAVSHVALPATAATARAGLHLYYSARDADGRSHIGRVQLDADGDELRPGPHDVEPVLSPGPLGAFDDRGVTMSCVVQDGSSWLLFYTGWSLGVTVPFYLGVGLAVSRDEGRTFERVSSGPVLDRNQVDPYLTASPFVLRDGDTWRMWYVSGQRWVIEAGVPKHFYHLRYAESGDGRNWHRGGRVVVDFADDRENAFGRPCVVVDGGRYRMWYCVRGQSYRLGYAESADGLSWTRHDAAVGLDPSPDGWDAEMIAYPHVVDVDGSRHLLYNGNGYGLTGVGYATAMP
jgi:hypothetical protein